MQPTSFLSPRFVPASGRALRPLLALAVMVVLQACGPGKGEPTEPTGPNASLGAPRAVSAVADVGSAQVRWQPPLDADDLTITEYVVTADPEGPTKTVEGTVTSTTLDGLANGTSYTFSVVAKTSRGNTPVSTRSPPITTPDIPAAPGSVFATAGAGQATVTWAAPTKDGGRPVIDYTVTATPGGASATVEGNTNTVTLTGLNPGTSYSFSVVARNAVGMSAATNAAFAVTTFSPPAPPSRVSATRGDKQLQVSWFHSTNNGGSPVTEYRVSGTPGGLMATVPATQSTATLTGLMNGTSYTFTVVAVNAIGVSGPSEASAPLAPANLPGAPTGATAATNFRREAVVTWTPPAQTGGIPITGYRVSSTPGGLGTTVSGSDTSLTVTGLANGTSYTFSVVTLNEVGASVASAPSNAIVTYAPPSTPTDVSAVRGSREATVSWTASTNHGGTPLTGYRVTASPGGAVAAADSSATSAVVTGLTNGTSYTFTVVAINAAGLSAPSQPTAPVVPASLPAAPANVTGAPGVRQVVVNWTATDNGGLALSQYRVTATPGGAEQLVAGNVTTATVTGLTDGTDYTFTVRATNALGEGPASATSAVVKTHSLPGSPTITNVVPADARATVTFSAPSSTGGSPITDYVVTASPGGATATVGATLRTATVTGLTNGASYTFTAIARSAVGDSAPSAVSNAVIPARVPDVPTAVSATVGIREATVSWTAPAENGGAAVTAYVIRRVGSSTILATTADGAATSHVVTGLTNNTNYEFVVHAKNVMGESAASTAAPLVKTPNVPTAPTAVAATRGNASATVTWTASSEDGGRAITSYVVTSTAGGFTQTVDGATLTATVTGLTNGTPYTFRVKAVNAVGDSPNSANASAVTPSTVPGAPTGVGATAGIRQATVTWTAPTSTGGASITGYTVTSVPGGFTTTVGSTLRTATVTGLANGTQYTFDVVATNLAGNSLPGTSPAATTLDVPAAPTGVYAFEGNASATIGWTLPASNGGSAVTSLTVHASPGDLTRVVGPTVTSTTMTGLTNDVTYTFRVTATNAVGASTFSDPSNPVTPATPPTAPQNVQAVAGQKEATVNWEPPLSNGGKPITAYKVIINNGPQQKVVSGTTFNTVMTNLTGGVTYGFTVVAISEAGESPQSTPPAYATVTDVPAAPAITQTVAGLRSASVTWTAANARGSAVTGYTVTASPGGQTATVDGTTLSASVTGLSDATAYTFAVFATNALGNGPLSASSSSITTHGVPGAPTAVLASAGNAKATVSWTAPASNGGTAITGYTVTSSPEGITAVATAPATTAEVTGLTNGTAYTFTVMATNAVGTSAASSASAAVTPAAPTAPGAVQTLAATDTAGNIVATWSAPASNGGSAITGYDVTLQPGGTATQTVTGTTATFTSPSRGRTYTVSVKAVNAIGAGPASQTTVTLNCVNPTYTATTVATGAGPSAIATSDFNSDGRPDFVTANTTAGSLTVALSDTLGGFTPSTLVTGSASPHALAVADFDNDGKADVAVAYASAPSGIDLYLGLGTGSFSAPVSVGTGPFQTLAAGDVNNDGTPELFAALAGGTGIVRVVPGMNGTFSTEPTLTTTAAVVSIAVADLNSNGMRDLVLALANGKVAVALGNGDHTFAAAVESDLAPATLAALAVGRFNSDAHPDVLATSTTGLVSLLPGSATGTLGAKVDHTVGGAPNAVALGDFDADSYLDAAVANETGNAIVLLFGNGDGTFTAHTEAPATASPRGLVSVDVNLDGRTDLISTNSAAATLTLHTAACAP